MPVYIECSTIPIPVHGRPQEHPWRPTGLGKEKNEPIKMKIETNFMFTHKLLFNNDFWLPIR